MVVRCSSGSESFLYYFVSSSSGGRKFTWRWISDLYYFLLFCVLYCAVSTICCGSSVHLAVDHFLYYFVNSSSGGREFTWRWISDLYYFLLFCVLYYLVSTICCGSSVHLAVDQRLSGGEYSTSVCLWQLRKQSETKF